MEPDYKIIKKQLNTIDRKVNALHHSDYTNVKENLKSLIWYNFLIGLSRGFGMAVGFTILGAAAIYIIQKLVLLNLPGISQWLAEVIKLAQSYK